MRTVEMLWAGEWVEVDISCVKKGEVFRMFEPDGTPVRDRGTANFVAVTDAEYNEDWEAYMVYYDPFYG